MTTQQLNINASEAIEELKKINQQLANMNNSQQQITQTSTQTTQAQSSLFSSMKKGLSWGIENYMNLSSVIKDVGEFIDGAYKRQAKWNALLNHPNYKRYKEQIDGINNSTNNLISLYDNSDTLQKLFNANVDLSSDKLTQLTDISNSYAKAMGVDATEAMQRFSEAIAEGATSKLEDLGIYIDTDTALTQYAISIGVAKDELTKMQEKQAVLNAILKNGKSSFEGIENPTQKYSKAVLEAKKNLDELTLVVANLGADVLDEAAGAMNTFVSNWKWVGESIYDVVHVFDNEVETIKGDVIPTTFALSNANVYLTKTINDVATANKNLGISSGVMAFQGISANNIKAIEDTQKRYEEAWRKAEELEKKINNSKYKRLEKQYNDKINLAKQTSETVNNFMLGEQTNIDDIFESSSMMKRQQSMNEQMQELEKQSSENRINLKQKEHEILLAQEKEYQDKAKSYLIDAANNIYSGIINSRENFLQETIALSMQRAGAEIFNDGLQGLWQGGRWMLSPYPTMSAQGAAMVGYSVAEMGAGVALGYAGAAAMPSTGGKSSEAKNKETAARDRLQNFDTQKKEAVVTYLYPDERTAIQQLSKINKKF